MLREAGRVQHRRAEATGPAAAVTQRRAAGPRHRRAVGCRRGAAAPRVRHRPDRVPGHPPRGGGVPPPRRHRRRNRPAVRRAAGPARVNPTATRARPRPDGAGWTLLVDRALTVLVRPPGHRAVLEPRPLRVAGGGDLGQPSHQPGIVGPERPEDARLQGFLGRQGSAVSARRSTTGRRWPRYGSPSSDRARRTDGRSASSGWSGFSRRASAKSSAAFSTAPGGCTSRPGRG